MKIGCKWQKPSKASYSTQKSQQQKMEMVVHGRSFKKGLTESTKLSVHKEQKYLLTEIYFSFAFGNYYRKRFKHQLIHKWRQQLLGLKYYQHQ